MANFTNSAKLIQEMNKKANRTELPEVNNSTVNFTVNGNTGSQSMTTNQASNSTVNLTVTKATVGLGNVDNTSDANKPISTATQAALDLKADKSDLSSVYKYKGSVASYSNLPSTGLTAGDVYNVEDTGMNYAWTGSAWDALGSTVDLSSYAQKSEVLTKTNTTSYTPTANYHPATKKYVDDQMANAGNVIAMTQDEYDALSSAEKADGKLRIITDAPQIEIPDYESKTAASGGTDLSLVTTGEKYTWNNKANASDVLTKTNTTSYTPSANYHPATKKYVDDIASGKQDTLVSGTNIKTINNESILGSGNITIQGGGSTYTAGEGIGIVTGASTKGPCPEGFHIPLTSELVSLHTIWVALGGGTADGANFGKNLKIPFAGNRTNTGGTSSNAGTYGFLWSASPETGANSYCLRFTSNTIVNQYKYIRSHCFSIRPFKDTPVIPTSSWTKMYGTSIEAGGIFWSATDGLVSLSSDGSTWVTISDKNCGATTVWNYGDTLTNANCGNMYQWGNNYGFPFDGTMTTSPTQVDAGGYGPGNYYSSDVFIRQASDWSSVDNRNLWGGEKGLVIYDNAIVNVGDNGKLDKVGGTSTLDRVYVVNTSGVQTTYNVSQGASNNAIVRRSGTGIIVPDTPGAATHAVNKNYVDGIVGNIETLLAAI